MNPRSISRVVLTKSLSLAPGVSSSAASAASPVVCEAIFSGWS